jgi:hypothetical protein
MEDRWGDLQAEVIDYNPLKNKEHILETVVSYEQYWNGVRKNIMEKHWT